MRTLIDVIEFMHNIGHSTFYPEASYVKVLARLGLGNDHLHGMQATSTVKMPKKTVFDLDCFWLYGQTTTMPPRNYLIHRLHQAILWPSGPPAESMASLTRSWATLLPLMVLS
ncbi:hypothetical protein HPB50_017171 [Hyalomma asiaticum]|uniref:Uncharacterized protein n=1 Tax=Hyalomma asiaticum TaxID=266040 RepID=A0ACB7RRD2_HYAAI|nr:hypothetical protein HPB50_017171 [Hyalomma asiaticum]